MCKIRNARSCGSLAGFFEARWGVSIEGRCGGIFNGEWAVFYGSRVPKSYT